METIEAFNKTETWAMIRVGLALWGLMGIVSLLIGRAETRLHKQIAWLGIALMATTLIFSMVFDTLLPIARETSWAKAAPVGFGMLGIFVGIVTFFYGGWLFVRPSLVRINDTSQPPLRGLHNWLPIWARGLFWLGIGLVVMLLSIWLYRNGLTS